MSGEAVAPQPQIGDVWTCDANGRDIAVSHQARADLIALANRNAASLGRDPAWRLVGRVVPVVHPGIEVLREAVIEMRAHADEIGPYVGGFRVSDAREFADGLADLLSLLAPSPGDADT